MGHTLAQWQTKVGELLRDVAQVDFTTAQLTTVAIGPAIRELASDRPIELVRESVGAGSSYFSMPTGWVAGYSSLRAVEYPARQNPPVELDSLGWEVVRSVADVAVQQILLRSASPAVGQYVRFRFTAPYPMPTATPADDLVDDVAYEPVASNAAYYALTSMVGEAARYRLLPSQFANESYRSDTVERAALAYRKVYLDFLGLATAGADGGKAGEAAQVPPAYGSYDLDPYYDSVFHGGRT